MHPFLSFFFFFFFFIDAITVFSSIREFLSFVCALRARRRDRKKGCARIRACTFCVCEFIPVCFLFLLLRDRVAIYMHSYVSYVYHYVCVFQSWLVTEKREGRSGGKSKEEVFVYRCICVFPFFLFFTFRFFYVCMYTLFDPFFFFGLLLYIHTYIYIYMHTDIYTYIHTYIHTCIRIWMYVHICTFVCTHSCSFTKIYKRECLCIHIYVHIYL